MSHDGLVLLLLAFVQIRPRGTVPDQFWGHQQFAQIGGPRVVALLVADEVAAVVSFSHNRLVPDGHGEQLASVWPQLRVVGVAAESVFGKPLRGSRTNRRSSVCPSEGREGLGSV